MRSITLFLSIIAVALVSGCASRNGAPEPAAQSSAAPGTSAQAQNNYRDLSALVPDTSVDSEPDRRALSDGPSGNTLLAAAPIAGGGQTGARSTAPASNNAAASGANAGAVPDTTGMTLGGGDVIQFNMSGQPDMTTTSYVSGEGTISLPLIQRVNIGGLTPSQAESRIAEAYKAGGYFNNPQVNVTITQYRSQQISVLGAVNKPGRYLLDTRTGVLDALAEAGGATTKSSRTLIVIRRTADGTRRYRLPLYDVVAGSGDVDSFRLAAGDTVFVPEAPLFYIYGEVQRPDGYAIKPGMTVMQAISTGGGLTERGSNSRILIHRKENGETREIKPELSAVVEPGDVIYVKERFF